MGVIRALDQGWIWTFVVGVLGHIFFVDLVVLLGWVILGALDQKCQQFLYASSTYIKDYQGLSMLVYIDRCIYRFQLQLKFEAIAVGLLLEMRPSLFVMVEQPSGSWGLKQDFMLKLMAAFGMCPGSARIILGCLFFSKNICWLSFLWRYQFVSFCSWAATSGSKWSRGWGCSITTFPNVRTWHLISGTTWCAIMVYACLWCFMLVRLQYFYRVEPGTWHL